MGGSTAALTLAALVLVAGPAVAESSNVALEGEEPDRLQLDLVGQRNCVPEALRRASTPDCPSEPTSLEFPAYGIRILDDYYVTYGPGSYGSTFARATGGPSDEREARAVAADQRPYEPNANFRRLTGGLVTDVIAPGAGEFVAWYGRWNDTDGDGSIDTRYAYNDTPGDHEWEPLPGAALYSWIEPGSHPTATSANRPSGDAPDILYYFQTLTPYDYRTWGGEIAFTDGSLLQSTRVQTVSDPIFAPSEDGRFPFAPNPGDGAKPASLIDIDVYPAVVSGPVANLYHAILGPTIEEIGSPSVGSCPNRCRPGPVPLGIVPGGTTAGAATSAIWGPYPEEWRPDSGSVAAGRLAEYEESYTEWLDLLLATRVGSTSGQLVGLSLTGAQTAAPQCVLFEAWVGLWKDVNLDGHVGRVRDPSDPYEGGTRPLADDYIDHAGEFVPALAVNSTGVATSIGLTITPKTDWGRGVTTCGWVTGYSPPPGTSQTPCTWAPLPQCFGDPTQYVVTGKTPIRLSIGRDASSLGHYSTSLGLLVPAGTLDDGFTVCTDAMNLTWSSPSGVTTTRPIYDCDDVERLG